MMRRKAFTLLGASLGLTALVSACGVRVPEHGAPSGGGVTRAQCRQIVTDCQATSIARANCADILNRYRPPVLITWEDLNRHCPLD